MRIKIDFYSVLHELSSLVHFFTSNQLSRLIFLMRKKNFSLLIRIVNQFRLTEPTGFIHDGLGNYSIGVKCSWLIDARDPYHPLTSSLTNITNSVKKKPKRIRLHLEEFATECSWDHLYIYDGDSVQSPLLAVFR